MSHTLRKVNLGNTAIVEAIIVDYVQGGEAFTLAELGLTGSVTRIAILKLSFPTPTVDVVVVGNKIVLQYPIALQTELPTTVGVNIPILAVVTGS